MPQPPGPLNPNQGGPRRGDDGFKLGDDIEDEGPVTAPVQPGDDPEKLKADPSEALEPEAGELPDGVVERVLVMGNRRVEDEAVRQAVGTRTGMYLDGKKIREDISRIYELGFFTYVMVDVSEGQEGPVVTFVVDEKPSVGKVLLEGNEEIDDEKINEVVDVKTFSILNQAKLQESVSKIRNLYSDKGFFLAEISYRLVDKPDNQVDVVFEIDENAKVEVRQISFIGNKALPDEELRRIMQTREGDLLSFLSSSGTYNEDVFQRDALILTSYYYDKGYINAKISNPTVRITPDKKYLYLSLQIEEGEQFYLGDLDFSGDILRTKDELFDRITLQKGDVFNRSQLLGRDLAAVTDIYRNEGYAYASITPLSEINPDTRMVNLTLDVRKGELVYFERIEIRGNTKTADHVIRREMRVYEGELYSQRLIDLSRQRVTALGFFEKVDVNTRPGSARNRIEIEVTIKERPTGTFQVGVGFSSVENLVAQAQISEQNLFGRGQSLSLQFQISSLRRIVDLSFVEPYFLDTEWTFSFRGFNTQRNFIDFIRASTGGSVSFGYRLTDYWRWFGTYTLENINVDSLLRNDIAPANLFNDGWTSSIQASLNYDSRNNRLFPSDGEFLTTSAEWAPGFLGSDNLFVRLTGNIRFYRPIWADIISKSSVRVGQIFSTDERQGVPVFERYFSGGIFSCRGYALRSVSPVRFRPVREPQGRSSPFNFGGNKEFLLNSEIEFPIFREVGIRGVVFYDACNTYSEEENWFYIGDDPGGTLQDDRTGFNPRTLPLGVLHSVGFGFRWFSPIGPLRFEWGVPLTPRPQDDSILFEFTIGNSL